MGGSGWSAAEFRATMYLAKLDCIIHFSKVNTHFEVTNVSAKLLRNMQIGMSKLITFKTCTYPVNLTEVNIFLCTTVHVVLEIFISWLHRNTFWCKEKLKTYITDGSSKDWQVYGSPKFPFAVHNFSSTCNFGWRVLHAKAPPHLILPYSQTILTIKFHFPFIMSWM